MSQKCIFREEVNQPSIRLFVGSSSDDCLEQTSTSTNTDEWYEHISKPRRRRASRKIRDSKLIKPLQIEPLVEDRIGGVNIIISGLAENPWEKDPVTMDRVYDVLSETIDNWNYQYRIDSAKKMVILRV